MSRHLPLKLFLLKAILGILLFQGMPGPAHAQLGGGWIPTSFTKRIHLDDDVGLQTFTWSSFRSVCSPTACADYSYDSSTDTETFRIFDSRSNRSEIRLQNDYSSGIWQFEGYVTFDAPLHDESLFQIFGNTGSAATFLMMRGYRDNGGTIRVMGGSHTIATGIYGQEVRINIIHKHNAWARFYVNGQFVHEKAHNDPGVVNYWKYGCYGTTSGNVPAIVKWRAVRTFRDGTLPEADIIPKPSAVTVAPGGSAAATITASSFSGNVSLGISGAPAGASATLNPATVSGNGGVSALTINTLPTLATGNYPLTISGIGGGTNRTATVHLGVVPPGWSARDIGSPGVDGWASFSGGAFTVRGSGTDIWSSTDRFNFAFQTVPGDGTLTARVDSQENTNPWAKSGVMFRDSTNANARFVGLYVTPANGVSMQYRSAVGSNAVDHARHTGMTAPHWVRLVRSGNTFTGYRSTDGADWTFVGTVSFSMNPDGSSLGGLAVTSHDNVVLNATVFSNVSLPPNYLLSAAPASRTVPAGLGGQYVVTLTSLNGFNDPVTFSVTPDLTASGISAGFNPPSTNGSGSTTLTIATSTNTPAGTYNMTVTGQSGGLVRTANITLITTANLVWNSSANAAWDISSTNWLNESAGLNSPFTQGSAVVFTDRPGVVTSVTIASGMTVNPATTLVDAEEMNYTISGSGRIGGAGHLTKSGSGTLTLNTTNEYTGITTLADGVLRVPWLADAGVASPIGSAASAANLVFNGGTLRWAGNAHSTINRGFTLAPMGGTLEASPVTAANLTWTGSIAFSEEGDRTLTLAGAADGGGHTLASAIGNGSGGVTSLAKNGGNTWILSSNNSFSGRTWINAGTLRANSAGAFGSGPVIVEEGGQAHLNLAASFPSEFRIAGEGVSEAGGSYGALRLSANGISIPNGVELTGNARITARGATASGASISGRITGDFALELGDPGAGGGPDVTNNIAATANAFVVRSSATTDQDESQTLVTKRLNDTNTRIAYTRFNLASFLAAHSINDLKSATLGLHLTGSSVADSVQVYGLRNSISGTNGFDALWTGNMTWNNQPARSASPNDITNSTAALPNANTTALLGTASFGTTPGLITISLNLVAMKNFLADDSNQQITLVFHNTGNNNASWASIANTGGDPVPTLQLVAGSSVGDPGVLALASSVNDWAGNTIIHSGIVKVGAPNVLPHGLEKGNVILHGSSFPFNSVLDLNGITTVINGLSSQGASARAIVSNSAPAATTLVVGDNDADGAFAGVIRNGVGTVGLTKVGAGTLILNGANLYTGPTTVSNGTLVINGSLGATTVTVRDGGLLAGNGTLAGSVMVNPGATISPGSSIGALTINNVANLQGVTFMELDKGAGTNDVIRSANTIQFGGTLTLTNLNGVLAAGDAFKLFDASSYSGAFVEIAPSSPGDSLVWNTNTLVTDGTLRIDAIAPSNPPVIASVKMVGGSLVVSGDGGPASGVFYVLSSTNLVLPLGQWTRIATNVFDNEGAFSITNSVNASQPQTFYRLELE